MVNLSSILHGIVQGINKDTLFTTAASMAKQKYYLLR